MIKLAKRKSNKDSAKVTVQKSSNEVPLTRLTAYVLALGAGMCLVLFLTKAELNFMNVDLPKSLYGMGAIVLGYLSYLNWQENSK